MLKTNFDGTIFEDLNATGVDVVVCNSLKRNNDNYIRDYPYPPSMVALETIVVRTIVQFVQELDLHNSIFEGDSKISVFVDESKNKLQSSLPIMMIKVGVTHLLHALMMKSNEWSNGNKWAVYIRPSI